MFSLIISIISIALVGVLSLASIYYGGEAFRAGIKQSTSYTLLNQAQQIGAAFSLSKVDQYDFTNATASDFVDRLVEGFYLKSAPQLEGNFWVAYNENGSMQVDDEDAKVIVLQNLNDEICDEIESMETESFDENSSHSSIGENQYGCDDSGNMYYKL